MFNKSQWDFATVSDPSSPSARTIIPLPWQPKMALAFWQHFFALIPTVHHTTSNLSSAGLRALLPWLNAEKFFRLALKCGTGENASYAGYSQVYIMPLTDFHKGPLFQLSKRFFGLCGNQRRAVNSVFKLTFHSLCFLRRVHNNIGLFSSHSFM